MTKTEIENLKLADCANVVFPLLGYTGEIKPKVNYKSDENLSDDENFYNSLGIDNPSITQVIDSLASYKTQLLSTMRENWKQYFNDNMGYYPDAMLGLGVGLNGNAKTKINSLISKDSELLEPIRFKCEEMKAEKAKQDEMNQVVKHGADVVKVCADVIALIAGINNRKGFTGAQLDAIQEDYMSVMIALNSYRPAKALALVKAKEADANYSQDDLDLIISAMEIMINGISA